MSKRSTDRPYLRSEGERKANISRKYGAFQKNPAKINPVFLKDHYGVKNPEKEKSL